MINEELLLKLRSQSESGSLAERSEIDENSKWDVTHIYSNEAAWEEEFVRIQESITGYDRFKGKISTDATLLTECIKFDEEVSIKLEKLYLYVMLNRDSDLRVNKYQGMSDRIKNLHSTAASKSSFILPELIETPEELIQEALTSGLKGYEHFFDDINRK
jgi:oligoendopeptidase F